jgi:two-component system OmpR family sensor kinase
MRRWRRAPRSLQGRLALALALALALLWAAAAVVTARHLRHELNEVFDSALEETAQRILPLAALEILAREPGTAAQRIETLREHPEYFTYVVRDAAGAVLMRSHAAELAVFPPVGRLGFETTRSHRVYHDAALQGALTISVAEPLARRRHVANETLAALALPLGLLAPVSLLVVWAVMHAGLRPLRRFRDAIARRGAADLAPLPRTDLPVEIAPVAEAVDGLMARLGQALAAERRFASNAAHELRTPLAAAIAQLDRLETETADPAAGRRAAEARAALWRLARRAEKLLQLARAESAALRRAAPADLAPVLRLVVAELDPSGTRVALALPAGPMLSTLDRDAFAIVARNLVENALRHGAPPVAVTLGAGGLLRVVNAGPAAPVAAADTDTRPLGGEGAGLGLAIVRTIVRSAGLRLDVRSPATAGGDGVAIEVAGLADGGAGAGSPA